MGEKKPKGERREGNKRRGGPEGREREKKKKRKGRENRIERGMNGQSKNEKVQVKKRGQAEGRKREYYLVYRVNYGA